MKKNDCSIIKGIAHKRCIECGEMKPLLRFHKDKYKLDGHIGTCKECKKIKYDIDTLNLEFRKMHNNSTTKYRKNNIEKCSERNRARDKALRSDVNFLEKEKERKYKYGLRNVEKIAEYAKDYYSKNTEKVKNLAKKSEHTRRALKAKAFATLTVTEWEESKKFFNDSCAYCGRKLPLAQEHVIPVSKGGAWSKTNIVPACKECNQSKHVKVMEVWYKERTFFNETNLSKIYKWTKTVKIKDYTLQQTSIF